MYNQGVYNRAHLTATGNVSTNAQFLHSVNINTAGTGITIADSVGTIAVYTTATGCFIFNIKVQGTLSVTIAGAADVTVSYM